MGGGSRAYFQEGMRKVSGLALLKATALAAVAVFAAHICDAFEVEQVFREERFARGNVNLRVLQPIDEADWIWIDDGGPAKAEMDAVRFSCDFAGDGTPLAMTFPPTSVSSFSSTGERSPAARTRGL